MLRGYLGKKVGMSRVFRDDGRVVPVTMIQAGPCSVTQIKTKESDGYQAVQLGFDPVKKLNKPKSGHLKGSSPVRHLREVKADDVGEFELGQQIGVDIFEPGELVDVIGTSKGRGFAGVMKRHGFGGGPRTHGSVRPGPRSRFYWRRHYPRQGVQGIEDGRPHGGMPESQSRTLR